MALNLIARGFDVNGLHSEEAADPNGDLLFVEDGTLCIEEYRSFGKEETEVAQVQSRKKNDNGAHRVVLPTAMAVALCTGDETLDIGSVHYVQRVGQMFY